MVIGIMLILARRAGLTFPCLLALLTSSQISERTARILGWFFFWEILSRTPEYHFRLQKSIELHEGKSLTVLKEMNICILFLGIERASKQSI